MSELKLLPCPFCGSPARVVLDYQDIERWAQCTKRKPESCVLSTAIIEIAKWNRRTQPEATKSAQDLSAAIDWLRNNYQDHTNIASLCDAMCAALASPVDAPNDSIRGPLRDADRQHCMSYAATLGVNRETAEAIINTTASKAYVNGFQDGKPEPADALVAGDRVDAANVVKLTDEQYLKILEPVLSRYGMQRYLNGDEITLDPSDYRAIINAAIQAQKDGHG